MTDTQGITLVSFGFFGKEILEKTAEAVGQEFNLPVMMREGHLDLSEYFDPVRRQYNGNLLLRKVDSLSLSDTGKILGLFSVDLFIPILTYIFGQAYLNGRTGIASLHRLRNEKYGMTSDDELTLARFKKESIHELGHTFGLIHCSRPECVMRSSTYVEDIDLKEGHFCMACRQLLSTAGQ
ncbi:MAG TPA: archaemetzincin family Zn-dependent metalloprotease [Bacteroidales bacterium]|nr:archaemetzincin family Zn-dependent metalloprotease [Bacteroidales bacterium]